MCEGVLTYLSSNATQGLILCWEPIFQRGTLPTRALCPHVASATVAPPMMCAAREYKELEANALRKRDKVNSF